jgi:hypothetical protein
MARTSTWKTECKKCKSPVYYYPAKLLLESVSSKEVSDDLRKRIVDCTCTGETENGKHTLTYLFPDDFRRIDS